MKQLLTIILLLIASASFSQIHKGFPVKELDSLTAQDTATFRHHPIWLDIDVNQVANFTAYRLETVVTYKEDISKSPFYKAKSTQTSSVLIIPKSVLNIESALKADGTFNITELNKILLLFGLAYDADSALTEKP